MDKVAMQTVSALVDAMDKVDAAQITFDVMSFMF